jgi:hypothetical protein
MPRAKFQQSGLNRKIKRHENIEAKRQENLCLLIQEYGLNPADFDMEGANAWQKLCMKMAEALVPGFQVNNSGNKRRNTLASDYEVYQEVYPLTTAEYEFDDDKSDAWRAKKLKQKQCLSVAAKKVGCTEDQARSAIQRRAALIKDNPATFYGHPLVDAPEYVTAHPGDDRHARNRKQKS